MEINLKQLITDVIKVKKYRCSSWANETELKDTLMKLLSSTEWESPIHTYYTASAMVSNVSNVLFYTVTPVQKSVWLPILESSFEKIISNLYINEKDPNFILLTEPIYEYLSLSQQVGQLTSYYIDAKLNNKQIDLEDIKKNIGYYCKSLDGANIIKLVEDDKYNNKGNLLSYLSKEWIESRLDYFYISTDQSSRPSNRTYEYCKQTQKIDLNESQAATNTFDIAEFMKKLTHIIENMRIAQEQHDTSIFDKNKNIIESMIIEFNVQKSEFEKSNPNNDTLMKLYRECDKLILEVKKSIENAIN